jgi:membrane-associated HD superfamily phosphohydrolase
MKIGKRSLKKQPGRRVDELHRSPTRFELFRAWIERIPKVRLYIGLTALTWLSLTALIGIGPRPLIERVIAQGIIDPSDRTRLESLELLQQADPWMALVGVGIVVAAEMWIAWYFLERFGERILKTNAAIRLVLAASLTVLFTALARFFIELDFDPYLTPLAGLSIIGTMLLGPRLMFLMVVITSVNVGILSGNNFLLTAALLLGSGFAIYTTVRVDSRQRLLKAGLVIAAVMGVVTFAVGLIGGGDPKDALWLGVLGLGNGLLSLMLAMVLMPFLEDAFNILTPMKLLELSDPRHPLLDKLLRNAPGTFSHSMQVGLLAERAAERVGADALLAQVGAYYHDMPQEILDIIAQHHGSTRIEYFYRKALEDAPDEEEVRESDFRYSSGLPRSKEAGIMMLADSIEATVKSLPKPTPKRIDDVVADTVRRKLQDGQFDECQLTMHDIHGAGEAIREALIGFLGPRIAYPEDSGDARNGKAAS